MKKELSLYTRLEALCMNIFAHSDSDYEITLSGNGTNCCEAANVAYAILDIMDGDGRAWRKANQKDIDKIAAKLRKQYGE
jgi:hypothetical protein